MIRNLENKPSTQTANESLLRAEIQFWRELIESLGAVPQPRESAERMHQALALAEYRLAELGKPGDLH
jgi:hypothetical protein